MPKDGAARASQYRSGTIPPARVYSREVVAVVVKYFASDESTPLRTLSSRAAALASRAVVMPPAEDPRDVQRALAEDGFVVLRPSADDDAAELRPPADSRAPTDGVSDGVSAPARAWTRVANAVWGAYASALGRAAAEDLASSLLTYDPEERLAARVPGFHARLGGRVDLDVSGVASLRPCHARIRRAVERRVFRGCRVTNVSAAAASSSAEGPLPPWTLGAIVSKPGDATQNWHQDGDSAGEDRGRTFVAFLALDEVTERDGPLEIVRGSHALESVPGLAPGELPPRARARPPREEKVEIVGDGGKGGDADDDDLAARRHFRFTADAPGTMCVMNYRCWHRGLANRSESGRPVLYARFAVEWPPAREGEAAPCKYYAAPRGGKRKADEGEERPRRVAPTRVG